MRKWLAWSRMKADAVLAEAALYKWSVDRLRHVIEGNAAHGARPSARWNG